MCDTLKFLAQLSPTLIRKLASVPLYIASLKPSAMTPLFASAQSIKGALSCTGFPKQQQKHSSTLIFLTLHVYSICGNKPHQGFWTSVTRFIAHLFLPFAAPPPSVLWPLRKLLLPPVGISLLGNFARAVCTSTLSHWTDISCCNYANSRLELYFSLWLCADMHEQERGPCCLF